MKISIHSGIHLRSKIDECYSFMHDENKKDRIKKSYTIWRIKER